MPTVNLYAYDDARVYEPNLGAGASSYMPVGLWSGSIYRSFVRFALPNMSSWRRVTSATLKLRTSTQFYIARGASPRILIRRVTANWTEGTADSMTSSNAINWSNQPATTATNEKDSGALPTTDNAWTSIDVLALFRQWCPKTVESGGGQPNYGFRLASFNEGSTTATDEFYTHETTSDPYIVVTYETNTAPNAPTGLVPAANSDGTATIAPLTLNAGQKAIAFSANLVDPDPGDYITAMHVQVYADSATDAVPGAPVIESSLAVSGSPRSATTLLVIGSAVAVGTTYRARMRFADKAGLWGAWSSLTAMRFIPNTVPGEPSNRAVDVATQTPNFYGSLVDDDAGATLSAVHILVYQDTAAGAILKWDSGSITVGGTRFSVAYGGSTLDVGTKYRWSGQVTDNLGSTGPLSPYDEWTPTSTVGPDNMTPRTVETKQASITPTLTVGHSSAFTQHQLEVAKVPNPSVAADYLWQPAIPTAYASTTTKAVTYAGSVLTWGKTYYWRAKVFVAGTTWTDWSPWYPFYINALPLGPVITIVDPVVDVGVIYIDPAGLGHHLFVGLTATPTIRAPFADPDLAKGYADVPLSKDIGIYNNAGGAPLTGYGPKNVLGTSQDHLVSVAMTVDTIYWTQVRWQDSTGQWGPMGPFIYYKWKTAYTITVGTAPAVGDPTPTFAWTTNRTQSKFRVIVSINATGEVVHDSGVIVSATTSYTMPGGILQSGVTYKYTVTSYDVDGLPATLT